MARRTPFPFRDHYDAAEVTHLPDGLIPRYIDAYEEALLVEYKSGDIDVASYHEGMRETYERVLMDLLDIDQALMDAYWQRDTTSPVPPTYDLPYTGGNPLISYEQIEHWTGRRLDAEQWERLDEAIPNSSIPDAIGTIVETIASS